VLGETVTDQKVTRMWRMNAAEQVLMVGINTTSTTLLSSLLNNTLSQRVTNWVEAHNHVLSPPNRAKLPRITVVVRETAAGERKNSESW
jgi:hypothetical protein